MSNEVSDFLRSVEQLNHSRDEDEEARSRELEEKLLQQRKERQARREGKHELNCTDLISLKASWPLPPLWAPCLAWLAEHSGTSPWLFFCFVSHMSPGPKMMRSNVLGLGADRLTCFV